MQMRMDRRFAVVLAVSLLWAVLVTAVFRRLSAGGQSRAAAPEKPLVVATRALPLGAVLTRDAVQLRSVPERLFPAGGFSRIEDVVDRPAVSGIQPEEPVVEARLAARGSGIGLAPLIPTGMRAIAVRVNDVVGVAGFVLPGMKVDVLITERPSNAPATTARTVLQNITVLSAGQGIQAEGKSSISAPVVTLLVTPVDAEALTVANNEGHIQLVLRNSNDDAVGKPAAARPEPPVSKANPPARTRRAVPAAPAPAVAIAPPAPPPPPVEQVVVIRGNVKTSEPAAKGGGQ
jgi:pilus assembly protein CpaB